MAFLALGTLDQHDPPAIASITLLALHNLVPHGLPGFTTDFLRFCGFPAPGPLSVLAVIASLSSPGLADLRAASELGIISSLILKVAVRRVLDIVIAAIAGQEQRGTWWVPRARQLPAIKSLVSTIPLTLNITRHTPSRWTSSTPLLGLYVRTILQTVLAVVASWASAHQPTCRQP
ncbi:hypothetical protein BDV10DRAFT_183936 [Aspergillus recurvatus]